VSEKGSPVHIDGVVLDMTTSRITEKEIKRLYSTLDTLVNHIPEGVILLDAENRIVLANPIGRSTLKELARAAPGDVLSSIAGRPLRELIVSPPNIVRHEVTSAAPSGRTLYYEVAARNISGDRKVAGTVVLLKDVTEERELMQRTQTRERLAAVGQLASGVAHDFSNVLTCVVGFSEMLLTDAELTEEVRRHLGAIHESGIRATELISQLLDFSRTPMGELRPLDLSNAVKDFIGFLDRIIPEDIQVSVGSVPGDYIVEADITKLQQVLANLAVNARDSMPGGGSLSFSLSNLEIRPSSSSAEDTPLPEMPEGKWVVVKVTDTGEGISPDVLPHIFDPFYTTKGPGKGTGLGLSQVYGIIKQHSGHITVDSLPQTGTTFSIYLPQATNKTIGPEADRPEGLAALPKESERTILVVEDDKAVRDLIVTVLSEMGHTCLEAADGSEALDIFSGQPDRIGLVVTDLVMPVMNGVTMSNRIKELRPDMDIIAVSGYPPREEDEKEYSVLFSAFVKKPFKAAELASEVARVIKAGKDA
jgi:signal transduction histidine kinase